MKSTFVDANVFLRYLTNDDPEKADRVEALLSRAARGEIRLITSDSANRHGTPVGDH
jgi:predicted nucleic acid-binding protein